MKRLPLNLMRTLKKHEAASSELNARCLKETQLSHIHHICFYIKFIVLGTFTAIQNLVECCIK